MMRKVLIVDDSAINRSMLREILESGYRIMEAADGKQALELLDREYKTISAVLLDIVMPGIDGYGVLERIRSDRRFSKMPVIMITANDDETMRVKSLRLRANDYVTKPYNPEILKYCLYNNIALCEANAPRMARRSHRSMSESAFSFKAAAIILCAVTLVFSLLVQHIDIQGELRKTCENVTLDFTDIMDSYQHSFEVFELILQEEIQRAETVDEIEDYLKTHDKLLLEIEGGDYDGVYMYHQGRYMYSWDTPYEVYAESGYDATKRPWYIGAVEENGSICFSTPYPSYANDYMLATISRLQDDGVTVIAYDIKLGEISKFVDRLNLYNGALALICDTEGNIIGSTEQLYLGGNYTLSAQQLSKAVEAARQNAEGGSEKDAAAVESALAQQAFVTKDSKYLMKLLDRSGTLQYSIPDFSFGYAYTNGRYTCFVLTPITTFLPQTAILWAALSGALILLVFLVDKMLRQNRQILSDALTGLNNRRAFIKYCDNHFQHHSDETIGLLMLDLNHFKQINDIHGHDVGDQALLDTAAVLKGACGAAASNFFLCRYGGDEFLLAARVPDEEALVQMSELISEGFNRKNKTSITPYILETSIGTSFGICADKKGMESLLKKADQAMYEAKRHVER